MKWTEEKAREIHQFVLDAAPTAKKDRLNYHDSATARPHLAGFLTYDHVCAHIAAALVEAEARGRCEYASLIDCLNTELRENYGDAYQADMDHDAKPALRKLVDLVRERNAVEAEARGRDAGLEEARRFVKFLSDTAHDQATMLLSHAENRDAAKLLFGLQHELWTLEDSIRALSDAAKEECDGSET